MKNYKDLKLNFSELAYITDVPLSEAKETICDRTGNDKAAKDDYVPVPKLMNYYETTVSHDPRYDKINKLVFDLNMKVENYKKCLNISSLIKKVAFTGGKTIFYKILSQEQIDHATDQLKMKHIHLFGKDSLIELENKLIKKDVIQI